MKSPNILRQNQSEFSKTGGIHASGLFNTSGKIIAVKEDVGRHNALDKLIGFVLRENLLDNSSQFLTCSGRLNFDLSSKSSYGKYRCLDWCRCANQSRYRFS